MAHNMSHVDGSVPIDAIDGAHVVPIGKNGVPVSTTLTYSRSMCQEPNNPNKFRLQYPKSTAFQIHNMTNLGDDYEVPRSIFCNTGVETKSRIQALDTKKLYLPIIRNISN